MRKLGQCTRYIQVNRQTPASESAFAKLVARASIHYRRNKTILPHKLLQHSKPKVGPPAISTQDERYHHEPAKQVLGVCARAASG